MKFMPVKNMPSYNFEPIYDLNENGFSTRPEIPSDFSLLISGAYTSLDICLETSTLCCISGLNPYSTWESANLFFPDAINCAVKVDFDFEPQSGMGINYASGWKTFFDKKTKVVRIGNIFLPHAVTNIEFNKNSIVSIVNGKLTAVWIKPIFQ